MFPVERKLHSMSSPSKLIAGFATTVCARRDRYVTSDRRSSAAAPAGIWGNVPPRYPYQHAPPLGEIMCGAALPGLSVTSQYMAGRDRLTPGDKTKTPPAAETGGVLSKKGSPLLPQEEGEEEEKEVSEPKKSEPAKKSYKRPGDDAEELFDKLARPQIKKASERLKNDSDKGKAEEDGYNIHERANLDRLIENTIE